MIMNWYYLKGDQQVGPLGEDDLKQLLKDGIISNKDLIWNDGMEDWVEAESVFGSSNSMQSPQVNTGQQASPFLKQQEGGQSNIYAAPQSNLVDGNVADELLKGVTIKRASFPLLLTLSIIGVVVFFVGYVLLVVGAEFESGIPAAIGGIILLLGVPIWLFATVLGCKYLYRCWYIVNVASKGNTIASPGQAVGFCFIPFFNLYWMYQAYWGWAKEYNRIFNHRAHQPTAGVFLAFCICSMPIVNYVAGMATFVLGPIMMYQMCKTINEHANA